MKNPTIDVIQVFCANFKCDMDLRLPPGLPRYINTIKWPSFENCISFEKLDAYSKKVKIHELELCLKKSRYSIETFHLVLSSKIPLFHLQIAINEHYIKTSIQNNFYTEKIIFALEELYLLPDNINREQSINDAEEKYNKWLQSAHQKCN